MKIYEKPLAVINKFEVEDVIAVSGAVEMYTDGKGILTTDPTTTQKTVTFKW